MPDDVKVASAYEQDFYAWGLDQAQALRAAQEMVRRAVLQDQVLQAALQALDWENLAEEIEGLARRDRRELASRVMTIVEHLVKLQFSSAAEPRAGWASTVRRERDEIQQIIQDSPSLRRELSLLVERKQGSVINRTIQELNDRGEVIATSLVALLAHGYSEEQITGDWLPGPPVTSEPEK